MSLTLQRISESEFKALKEEWNRLLSRSASNNVFLRWEWIHTWWSFFHSHRELFIWTARQDGDLVGVAPFYIDRPHALGLRSLKFCSDELSPDYLDVIVEKGRETEFVSDLFRRLHEGPRRWDVIAWDPLRADSLLLQPGLLPGHYEGKARRSFTCPYIPIQGTFENYYRSRLKHGVNRLHLDQKKRALFDRNSAVHVRVNEAQNLASQLDSLFVLHAKRAGVVQRDTTFVQPSVKQFHYELSRLFLEEKILNLQFILHGNEPISAAYGFDYGRKTYFFQSGFDPACNAWSPGSVLLAMMIEQAFEAGFEEFDFLKGDERYKSLWTDTAHEEMQMKLYNRTLLGTSLHTAVRWKPVLKSLKTSLSFGTKPAPQEVLPHTYTLS